MNCGIGVSSNTFALLEGEDSDNVIVKSSCAAPLVKTKKKEINKVKRVAASPAAAAAAPKVYQQPQRLVQSRQPAKKVVVQKSDADLRAMISAIRAGLNDKGVSTNNYGFRRKDRVKEKVQEKERVETKEEVNGKPVFTNNYEQDGVKEKVEEKEKERVKEIEKKKIKEKETVKEKDTAKEKSKGVKSEVMTLDEYEKKRKPKENKKKTEERKVNFDKDFESMRLVCRNDKEDDDVYAVRSTKTINFTAKKTKKGEGKVVTKIEGLWSKVTAVKKEEVAAANNLPNAATLTIQDFPMLKS